MKTNEQFRSGVVLWFDEGENRGQMMVAGEPHDVWFSLDSQREIVAGLAAPKFLATAPTSSTMPQPDMHVVATIQVRFDRDANPERVTLKRVVEAVAWNYLQCYQRARWEIEDRLIYQVVQFTLCNGEPVSVDPRKVIAVGTAAELQFRYPRGVENDPLAQEARCMDIQYRRRFQLKDEGEDGRWCDDPRSLPPGMVSKPVLPINGKGELLPTNDSLDELVALANGAGGKRAGTETPHPRTLVPA